MIVNPLLKKKCLTAAKARSADNSKWDSEQRRDEQCIRPRHTAPRWPRRINQNKRHVTSLMQHDKNGGILFQSVECGRDCMFLLSAFKRSAFVPFSSEEVNSRVWNLNAHGGERGAKKKTNPLSLI